MPFISVRMIKGRPLDTKRRLAAALTSATADILEVDAKSVTVLIEEFDREDWAIGGELLSERSNADGGSLRTDLEAFFKKPSGTKKTTAPAAPAKAARPQKAATKSRPRR